VSEVQSRDSKPPKHLEHSEAVVSLLLSTPRRRSLRHPSLIATRRHPHLHVRHSITIHLDHFSNIASTLQSLVYSYHSACNLFQYCNNTSCPSLVSAFPYSHHRCRFRKLTANIDTIRVYRKNPTQHRRQSVSRVLSTTPRRLPLRPNQKKLIKRCLAILGGHLSFVSHKCFHWGRTKDYAESTRF
jgi:hypothetical protein